jgi:hypothetical protein
MPCGGSAEESLFLNLVVVLKEGASIIANLPLEEVLSFGGK